MTKKMMSDGMRMMFKQSGIYHAALKVAPLINLMPRALIYCKADKWGIGRELPQFAKQSFNSWWKKEVLKK